MKAKITKGKGFGGSLRYVLEKENAWLIGGNMLGDNPRELAAEFGEVRRLRPDVEKPVWHCSLSLPAGEHLSDSRWYDVASAFMSRMGFDATHPWVAVRHNDTAYEHVHIIASRIDHFGRVWDDFRDVFRAIKVTQELERDYQLEPTVGLHEGISRRIAEREARAQGWELER